MEHPHRPDFRPTRANVRVRARNLEQENPGSRRPSIVARETRSRSSQPRPPCRQSRRRRARPPPVRGARRHHPVRFEAPASAERARPPGRRGAPAHVFRQDAAGRDRDSLQTRPSAQSSRRRRRHRIRDPPSRGQRSGSLGNRRQRPLPGTERTAKRMDVDVAIINAGGVRFGLTGPFRYTMTGAQAVRLIDDLRPRVAVPAHYNGWSHFRDGPRGMREAAANAPLAIRDRIRWLPGGQPTDVYTTEHPTKGIIMIHPPRARDCSRRSRLGPHPRCDGRSGSRGTVDAGRSAAPKPTIVLVHGAFADSSGWNDVATVLLANRYPVIAFSNSLRGPDHDSQYLRDFLTHHRRTCQYSWATPMAGLSSPTPAAGNQNVKSLVYIAAYALDEGETVKRPITSAADHTEVTDHLLFKPFPGATRGQRRRLHRPVHFPRLFAQDVPESLEQTWPRRSAPARCASLVTPSGVPAWKTIPSWYMVAAGPRSSPEAERAMAAAPGSTVVEVNTSHVPMISKPRAVVDLIRQAGSRADRPPRRRSGGPAARPKDSEHVPARRLTYGEVALAPPPSPSLTLTRSSSQRSGPTPIKPRYGGRARSSSRRLKRSWTSGTDLSARTPPRRNLRGADASPNPDISGMSAPVRPCDQ